MVSIFRLLVLAVTFSCSLAYAKGGRQGFGLHAGIGLPFVQQAGVNYYFTNDLGLDIGYNILDLSIGDSKVTLSMPEVLLKWHPFKGSFFVGAGLGQEKLSVKATDLATGEAAKLDIEATTTIAKLGWMWGSNNGGFWFGVDASYIVPSGAKTTVTSSLPPTHPSYVDVVEQGDKFGKMAFTNITFARLGWIF